MEVGGTPRLQASRIAFFSSVYYDKLQALYRFDGAPVTTGQLNRPGAQEDGHCIMKRIVITFTLVACLTQPALAGFDEAGAAYDKGDFETAYGELVPLAEEGDPGAQVFLGFLHENGEGTPPGRRRGRSLVPARRRAGLREGASLSRGHVRRRSGRRARRRRGRRWYRLAAEQGYSRGPDKSGLDVRKRARCRAERRGSGALVPHGGGTGK